MNNFEYLHECIRTLCAKTVDKKHEVRYRVEAEGHACTTMR